MAPPVRRSRRHVTLSGCDPSDSFGSNHDLKLTTFILFLHINPVVELRGDAGGRSDGGTLRFSPYYSRNPWFYSGYFWIHVLWKSPSLLFFFTTAIEFYRDWWFVVDSV